MLKKQDKKINRYITGISNKINKVKRYKNGAVMIEKIKGFDEKRKIILIFLIMVAIILLIFIGTFITFSVIQTNDDTIKKGIYIAGIDVSGLTKSEAIEKVEEQYLIDSNEYIYLKYNSNVYCISVDQIEAKFDIELAVETAYDVRKIR